MKRWLILAACLVAPSLAWAQAVPWAFVPGAVNDEIVDLDRPRIAAAADGSFALAFEALVQGEFVQEWQIAVQRFSPSGDPVGPLHLFEPESGCSDFDSWLSDWMEHAELAFRADGILLVIMQHSGEFQFAGDGVQSAEATLGAVDTNGEQIDLNGSDICTQMKLIFPGGDRQDRPRMALTPSAEVVITVDGFFGGSNLRNVAIRALDADLNELLEEFIPHDDPGSEQAFHMMPDVATNGTLILSVWQECPIVDAQGNADECDVGAQFARGLTLLGGNRVVNSGDPPGTVNFRPSAEMNASGQSVVVWVDGRTGSQGDVLAQRFDADGQPVGDNVQISAGEGEIQGRPEVAMLDDGRFTVTWTDSSAVGFRARARRFAADGEPLEAPFELQDATDIDTGLPHVASTGSAYLYVWAGVIDGSPAIFTSNLGRVVAREPAAPEHPTAPSGIEVYPHPITTATTVQYTLPETASVNVTVYDLLGREVARLVDERQEPGTHRIGFDGAQLPAGSYLVRVRHGEHVESRVVVRVE